ncbi:MAG: TIGR03668 family PPOX class F420-dependent oxidoreductase [Lapillicoccus sp.]
MDATDQGLARVRLSAARVARLATVRPDGQPHLVPIVFALVGDVVWSAVDGKPKSTRALQRLANIEAQPRVSLLVDHYAEDWDTLWWVRVDGHASVVPVTSAAGEGYSGSSEASEALEALEALTEKYAAYVAAPPTGPLVRIAIDRWAAWSAR